tara:strand:- start:55 stop:570 length:516 start_codon:yes stop_codon:yes gene_type:complete
MDYKEILSRLLSGKNNKFPNTGMEGGNSEFAIPMGTQETYRPDLVERSAPEDELHIPGAAGVYGGGFNTLRSGSGAEQIPTRFQNEYVAPQEDESNLNFSQYRAMQDMADNVAPYDTPPRQPSAIEEPIQPMLMERGEVAPISPVFGKQSLAQIDLDEKERLKMAQVLRGY